MITLKEPIWDERYPTDGLIGEWLFNDNLNDTSPSQNNLTNNGITFADSGISSLGRCGNINGGYATAPKSIIPENSPYSVAFWVKTTKTSADGWLLDSYASSKGFRCYFNTSGSLRFLMIGICSEIGSSNIADGNWHLITITWNGTSGGTITMYVDGVSQATTTASNTFTHGLSIIYVGRSEGPSTTNRFVGGFDNFRTYNRVLNTTEVSQLYNNGQGI